MSGQTFSNCAFNNECDHGHPVCLIANWFEEGAVRSSCGVGRSVPQTHIKRSGLLKDFTKMPIEIKKTDDTFERVYGPMAFEQVKRSTNMAYGHGDKAVFEEKFEDFPVYGFMGETVAIGDKMAAKEDHEIAMAVRAEEDAAEEALLQVRHFDCANDTFSFQGDIEKAACCKPSAIKTLFTGPMNDPTQAHGNKGLQSDLAEHYSTQIACTLYSEKAGNRSKVHLPGLTRAETGTTGPFNKNTTQSTPVEEYLKSSEKGLTLRAEDAAASSHVPAAHANAFPQLTAIPQLSQVKQIIVMAAAANFDSRDAVVKHSLAHFRAAVTAQASEGFISCSDLSNVIRGLGVTEEHVPQLAMDIYLDKLCTLRKKQVKIDAFFASLRCVVTRSHDEIEKAWMALAGKSGALYPKQLADAFVGSERYHVLQCCAALGFTHNQAMNYADFGEYMADIMAVNGRDQLRVAMPAVAW